MEELKRRDYRRVLAASMREGLDLLKRGGHRARDGRPVRPTAAADDRLARLAVQQCVPQALEDRRQGEIVDGRRSCPGRKTEIDYLNGELVRWPNGFGARRRSTARSSSWCARPRPARSRLARRRFGKQR